MTATSRAAPGRFGDFGGRFVPEALIAALDELDEACAQGRRPTPRSSASSSGCTAPTPAGRASSPRCRGSPSTPAARGSSSSARTSTTPARTRSTTCSARRCSPSGWARRGSSPRPAPASTASPRPPPPRCSGLECMVYMGEVDTERQALNVARMRLLGAEVVPVDARQRARSRTPSTRRCATGSPTSTTTHYLLGTVAGPHPFPEMVRDFHRVIGERGPRAGARPRRPAARRRRRLRRRRLQRDGHLPPRSSTTPAVRLVGFEAGGEGVDTGRHAARFARRHRPACCTARCTYVLQDDDGQTVESHSISAGLDYPSVGPEHAYLRDIGRAEYRPVTDDRGDGGVPRCCAAPRASSRPSSRARPRRRAWRSAASSARTPSCWSTSPAAATRTWTPPRRGSACIDDEASAGDGRPRAPRAWGRSSERRDTVARVPRARAAPPSSATCRSASRPSTGSIEAMTAHGRGRRRRHRGRPALLRPASWTARSSSTPPSGALARRHPRRRRLHAPSARSPTPARRCWS